MPSKLGYWDIRGLAQPIRFLLEYAGEDYENVVYVCGDGPDFDRSCWMDVKLSLGLDFSNLPYYIDGDIKITQSNAILRHLARKHNLYGDNAKESAYVDLLLEQIMDMRNGFVSLCYGPGYGKEKIATYSQGAKGRLEAFEKYLGSKKFFIGDKSGLLSVKEAVKAAKGMQFTRSAQVTVCDFHIYEMVEQHRLFDETLLANTPNLKAYLKRFEELPAIKKYLNSGRFKARPINNKNAHFL